MELPTIDDLHGAIKGLVRLHRVYQLKPADFAKGILNCVKTGAELSLHDVFTIGHELVKIGYQNHLALEYLKLAESMNSKTREIDSLEIKAAMMQIYAISKNAAGAQEVIKTVNPSEQGRFLEELQKITKQLKPVQSEISGYANDNPFNESFILSGNFLKFHERNEMVLLQQTCRGLLKKNSKEQSKLKCRYHSTNQFTRLARFKVEIFNAEPELMLFYDIMSETEMVEIESIFQNSTTQDSGFHDSDGNVIVNDHIRVADQNWLDDGLQEIDKKLTRRLEVNFTFIIYLSKMII